jgi:hypothetical protein|tara:strand:+ start:64 stop:273 length:210 start_codon:yes stop_codon:yes gene_type:complete
MIRAMEMIIRNFTITDTKMSNIENLLYSAYEHGKRDEMYKKVTEIRRLNNTMPLEKVYEEAYQQVMKTG